MTLPLLVGIAVALAFSGAALALRRAPRRRRCPGCGAATRALVPPRWLGPSRRWIELRWCAECSWQGLARRGPPRIPGRKVAHDSGFHWNPVDLPPDLGFQWRAPDDSEGAPGPPHHPSGFRFAAGSQDDDPSGTSPGFTWGRRSERSSSGRVREPARRPRRRESAPDSDGFRWREDGPSEPGTRWGE